ncbi:EAL domain-containing protein (putative c-di-GMP-specific phosphodiesterase class I)/CHASE2 domain-containing sensor protein [Sphingobium sp. B1D7B]|uniref:EAL domain-containing protein n=1 Tax=unclassified Sphingobium TaxID=2611147 RepID=UPI00222563D6|nr:MULTISPECIES: EAL domain-containing protein [unclassified Sphingobium]MCW2350864.1 EAL domain-containing protein (putative c-di-GMP-specific phosphodiesterase class I)/CHASE2 domain-containing sensor protein [Sphingobium sp. B12D2B]MCW2393498.1 EAL domain-containing protein (putative c-di-GMP-specific phosphodiesterase class I)/CHASE2 domain-containing sensor protein [Sphingobium sp. B11D3A]MCW2405435.1 EAL domain-containing protein (putative c-di-GMP-specific phosphodiesterase class I)/CHASE
MLRLRLLARLTRSARSLILAAACLIGMIVMMSGAGTSLDNLTRTERYQHFPKQPSGELVIVKIDTPSIKALGTWPWPRGRHGELIDALNRAGAERIVSNIIFDQPAADPAQDDRLIKALAASKADVYLAALLENRSNGRATYEALPTEALLPYVTPVNVWLHSDPDQYYRRLVLNAPVLGTELRDISQALAGTNYPGEGSFPIDWSYWWNQIDHISYSDVLAGKFPKDFFKGKKVLVGIDAFGFGDQFNVPYHEKLSSLYVFAAAAETLIAGLPVEVGPWPAMLLALALIGLSFLLKPRFRYPLYLAGTIGLVPAQIYTEHLTLWRPDVGPAILTLVAALVAQSLLSVAQALLDRSTKSAEAGLPNLAAMVLNEGEEGVTIVVSLRNYVETTALLGLAAQGTLLAKIRDRLILAAGHERIYQIDNHSFAWRSREDVPQVVDSLEGLEALFAPGVQVEQLTVDITLHAGFCDKPDMSVSEAIPKAVLAATNATNRGILWERYETEEDELFWKLSILNEFEQALRRGDVWVAYQPKLDLHGNRITSAEALIRWIHPERGFIRPDRFVRAIEDAGRIERLTLYVLERAIADFAPLNLSVAVNLSMRMVGKNKLEAPLRLLLDTYGMPAENLTLEITESASMADEQGIAELESLRAMGVHISIDDYGTGQSTLSYLKRLPASELKIDQSFVRQILTSRSDAVLINSTIKLAHELDMQVVAEGVEDENVLQALAAMECDIIQGYHIGRPVALPDFLANLQAANRKAASRARKSALSAA